MEPKSWDVRGKGGGITSRDENLTKLALELQLRRGRRVSIWRWLKTKGFSLLWSWSKTLNIKELIHNQISHLPDFAFFSIKDPHGLFNWIFQTKDIRALFVAITQVTISFCIFFFFQYAQEKLKGIETWTQYPIVWYIRNVMCITAHHHRGSKNISLYTSSVCVNYTLSYT